jgi:hypothetical protein
MKGPIRRIQGTYGRRQITPFTSTGETWISVIGKGWEMEVEVAYRGDLGEEGAWVLGQRVEV